MRIDTPEHMNSLQKIFPLIPRALRQIQSDIDPRTFRVLGEGARAHVVHDIVMKEAEETFDEDSIISIGNSRGLRHFVLPDVFIRLHRSSGPSLRISTNRTGQSQKWNVVPRNLPTKGVPDPNVRFHLVYVPDFSWTNVERCAVGLYRGNEAIEVVEIDVDGWYRGEAAQIDEMRPGRITPRLTLKPQERTRPMEGLDDDTGT